jgi:diguanylate cyclase (GGDEF)-like protein
VNDSVSAKVSVLVVEDSPAQREHIVHALEKRGYAVRSASGGLEALKAIKSDPPDVVVLDVILDDLDGYSVCRWIRLADRQRYTVVVMLTVKAEPKERIEGLHVGADDYLPKPFDDDELEARIFAALRTRGARETMQQRNAELETMLARTEQLAMTDALTGLFNRRKFLDVFKREHATHRRYGNPLSVAIIDLDHFKEINDSEGHAAGDDVLKKCAAIIAGAVREVDVVARWGGDEFVVLMPHTPRAHGIVAVARAQARLRAARQMWGPSAGALDLSAGVASTEDPALKAIEDMLESADRALYEAKDQRGRIVVARDGILDG